MSACNSPRIAGTAIWLPRPRQQRRRIDAIAFLSGVGRRLEALISSPPKGSSARSKMEIARACHFLTGQVISQWAPDGDASASHDGIASAAATYADVTEKVDGRGLMESNDVSVDANA